MTQAGSLPRPGRLKLMASIKSSHYQYYNIIYMKEQFKQLKIKIAIIICYITLGKRYFILFISVNRV